MATKVELKQAREALKRDILTNQDSIPVARIFSIVDRILRKITRRKKPYPWYVGAITLALIVPLPTIVLSFALKENEQWEVFGLIWIGYLEYAVISLVFDHFVMRYLFHNLQEYIIDKIENTNDLEHLGRVLSYAWRTPKYRVCTFIFTVFWCIAFSSAYSISIGQFIGFGLAIGTIIWALLFSCFIYLMFWYMYFIPQLGLYSYTLNDVAPDQSELIFHLSRIFKSILYFAAFWGTISVVIVSFNEFAIWLSVFFAWIPTAVIFVETQNTIQKIITAEKWKTLNRLQLQIKELHNDDISDKANIETIHRLMDYHERIYASRNSTFDIKTVLSFLNQLALPLLGFLLANIEKVLSIFK